MKNANVIEKNSIVHSLDISQQELETTEFLFCSDSVFRCEFQIIFASFVSLNLNYYYNKKSN